MHIVVPPFWPHFHEQLQEDLLAEKGLDVLSGFGTQFLDHLTPLPQDNSLLGFPVYDDIGPDFNECRFLLEFLHQYRSMIGNFFLVEIKDQLF